MKEFGADDVETDPPCLTAPVTGGKAEGEISGL